MPAFAAAGPGDWVLDVIREAGGETVAPEEADGLVWTGRDPDELRSLLERAPRIRWVQLPFAGVERYTSLLQDGRTWTSAKGVYGPQVAEHALALILAGFRRLKERSAARSWNRDDHGQSLIGVPVTVLGGGGIGEEMVKLLQPFGCPVTVVRKHQGEIPGVRRVLPFERLLEGVKDAGAVVVAWALTPETDGAVNARVLRAMSGDAWLVNVARGRCVVTEDLVSALREHWIGGAGLDVTDPEPLPDGHPLWDLPNCIITPHCANPGNLARDVLAPRIRENVRRFLEGRELAGLVDPELGY